jgi:hypothetical protein
LAMAELALARPASLALSESNERVVTHD